MIAHIPHDIPDGKLRIRGYPEGEMVAYIKLPVEVGEIPVHLGRIAVMAEEAPNPGVTLAYGEEIYAELKLGVHPEMYALSTLFFCGVLVFAALLMLNYKVITRYRQAEKRGQA